MTKKSNKTRWVIALVIVVLLGVLAYSTWQQTSQRYEVCVTFNNASHCAIASGSSYDQAIRSAEEIDCQLLANGRDENMVCLDRSPSSVRKVK